MGLWAAFEQVVEQAAGLHRVETSCLPLLLPAPSAAQAFAAPAPGPELWPHPHALLQQLPLVARVAFDWDRGHSRIAPSALQVAPIAPCKIANAHLVRVPVVEEDLGVELAKRLEQGRIHPRGQHEHSERQRMPKPEGEVLHWVR